MRKKAKKVDIIIIAVILLMIIGGIVLAVLPQKNQHQQTGNTTVAADTDGDGTVTYKDYIGKRIGIITGTNFETPTLEYFPNSEYLYFNSYSDIGAALTQNKIDGFLGDEPALRMIHTEQPQIGYLNELITHDNYAFGFQKNNAGADDIREKFNRMIAELSSDGTLDDMKAKWFGNDESRKVVDLTGFTGENGILNVVTTSTDVPFSYIKDNQTVGFSIELVERFCRKYGYTPNIEDTDFSARIPGLVSGKYDMCASSLTVTEERKESINFSEPIYNGGIAFAVRTSDNAGSDSRAPADTDGDGTVTYKDYIGKRIGIKTGSSFEAITFEYFPDSEYVYMESTSDLAVALEQNKIDAFMEDEPVMRMLNAENSNLDHIKQPIVDDDYSFMFQKGNERADKLRQQFNEMVSELNESGKLSEMTGKWFSNDDSVKTFDRTPSSGENGEIVAAGWPDNVPFSYYLNNEYTGFAVELITIFGQKYGYSVKFEQPNLAAVVAGVTSGLYDIGIGSISVTEERKESANFSDTVYKGGVMLAVRASDIAVQGETAAAGVNGGGSTYKDFNGKTLGILSGSAFEPTTFEKFPDSEYLYFNTYSDLNIALLEKRIDGYVADGPTARVTHKENSDISYLSEPLAVDSYYFMYSKTEAKSQTLLKQFNEMLSEMTSDGTLAEMQDIWFGGDASLQTIDRSGITGENGIITVGTYSGAPPFTMFVSGELSGMTTDLMYRFARKYGYEPKFEDTDVNGLLAGLASGKYNMLAAPLSKTPERAEAADFSDPFYSADICLAVRTENVGTPALSYKDYAGKRVGILTGSSFEQPTFEFLPDSEYFYFDSFSDLIMALATNKIDCFIEDEPLLRAAAIDHPELSYLPEILKEDKYSFCFQKNGEKAELLQKQFNEMIAELEADGTMESLRKKWYDGDASAAMIDRSGITGENGTLNVFVNPLNVPTAMIVDGELKGYAVELMTMFCRKYGYDCKYEQANISSGLAGIASGIYDVGANNVTVTPEREESVRFSDPIYYGGISLAVRKSDIYKSAGAADAENTGAENIPGFFDSIALSFEKNFIRENRWELIAEGIGTTCLITVMSAIFGSVLAFLVCMFRRTGSRLANGISNVYVKLLQGTPIVVLLMILYYVVLGKSGFEAVWVAVIGFTLNFGAYASEIMRSGIEGIDVGQREAALALGYTENQSFFKFIFPQAAVRFLPVYRGEIVSLLKSTSIVGYIAIQDLTKMSDIIRSRTYEAFFPLIATAIIYFVLAWIISLMLKLVLKAIDKRSRKRGTSK